MSKSTYQLQAHDTISYADEHPHTVKLFKRSDPNTIIEVLTLDAEFDAPWQAAVTRKAVLANGEINTANWSNGPSYEPPPF